MVYSKYNKVRFQGEKPVNEGETYDLEVEGIGTKGDGIGKIKGFVVIVPNVKVGEKVKVKVNAIRGKVAFAEKVGDTENIPNKEPAEKPSTEDSSKPNDQEVVAAKDTTKVTKKTVKKTEDVPVEDTKEEVSTEEEVDKTEEETEEVSIEEAKEEDSKEPTTKTKDTEKKE